MPFQAHWTQVPSAFSGMKQQSQLWNSQQHSSWNSQPSTTDVLTNSNSSGEFLVGLNQLLCLAANTSPPKFWSPPAFGHCKLHFSQAKQSSVKATPNNTSAVEMLSSGITKSRNTWNNKIQKASQHPKTQNSFIPQSAAEPGHSPLLSQKDNLFSCCFPPHFISSSVALRGAGLPRELRALLSLWAPTMDSWNQTQHFPSLYILQGPQLHQRICLLSLNHSLSIQKPKKPPTKLLQGSFSQLCSLKTH